MATEKEVKTLYSNKGGAFLYGKGSALQVRLSKTDDDRYFNLSLSIVNLTEDGKFAKIDDAIDSGYFSISQMMLTDFIILLDAMAAGNNNDILFQSIKDGKGSQLEIVKEGKVINMFIEYIDNNSVSKSYTFDFTRNEEKQLVFFESEDPNAEGVKKTIENYAFIHFINIVKSSMFFVSGLFCAADSIDKTSFNRSTLGGTSGAVVRNRRSTIGSTSNSIESDTKTRRKATLDAKSIKEILDDDEDDE